MPKVRALREVRYAAKMRAAGDEFEASQKDAFLLNRIGKVEYVEAKAPPTRADQIQQAASEEESAKRRYRRRDMTAEGTPE